MPDYRDYKNSINKKLGLLYQNKNKEIGFNEINFLEGKVYCIFDLLHTIFAEIEHCHYSYELPSFEQESMRIFKNIDEIADRLIKMRKIKYELEKMYEAGKMREKINQETKT